MKRLVLWVALACLMGSACAQRRTPAPLPLPSHATQERPAPRVREEHPSGASPSATGALLADAAELESRGDLRRAGATLERALRITPDDPRLWHRLAAVRLEEGRTAQAEQLARKSNLLASSAPELRARNWELIARARRMEGDEDGARSAQEEAERLGAPRR